MMTIPAAVAYPMKTIDRYIGSRFLMSFFLIILILAVLFSFFRAAGPAG